MKKNKVPWLTFANIIGPLIFLGYAVGRLGCFLVGDDYGIPSNLPWAMSFPKGIPPTTTNVFSDLYPWIDISGYEPGLITVHPTQLYEAMICFLLFFIMWKFRKSSTIKDLLFFLYLKDKEGLFGVIQPGRELSLMFSWCLSLLKMRLKIKSY